MRINYAAVFYLQLPPLHRNFFVFHAKCDMRFFLGNGAQVVLLHCRLVFTLKIEDAIVNDKLAELIAVFDAYIAKLQKHDAENEDERLVVENLLIEINDQKEAIMALVAAKCKSIHRRVAICNY